MKTNYPSAFTTVVIIVALGIGALFAPGEGLLRAVEEPARAEVEGDGKVEMANLVTAKRFCVALRRGDSETLRSLIDPRYLESHGEFNIVTAPVMNIFQIEVAADGNTVLCLYETADSKKEAMLLRTSELGGEVYVVPPGAPGAPESEVEPWILRSNVDKFAER